MRSLDAHAIDDIGIPGMLLMENAALAVLQVMEERYDDLEELRIAVVCGPGNNGGDGFALARQLQLRSVEVDVYLISDPAKLTGDAKSNFQILKRLAIPIARLDKNSEGVSFEDYDLIVDAIFGTGTARAHEGVAKDTVNAINDSGTPVIAIDLPSGVEGSSGDTPGEAVVATVTVALAQAKVGHFFPPGRDHCGDIIVSPISIPEPAEDRFRFDFVVPMDDDVAELLPIRARDAHKGDFGKLLIVAGSRGMSGAARLAAAAAYRSGVGLVKVACPESIRAEVAAGVPEATTLGLPETVNGTISESAVEVLKLWLDWPDVLAVGSGIGRDEETAEFLKSLFSLYRAMRMVLDADALNLIADAGLHKSLPPQSILTPHAGEFVRLAKCDTSFKFEDSPIFADRVAAGQALSNHWQLPIVLKGSPTVVVGEQPAIVNPTGNPGLATGGTGDVLTGIVASLAAQGLDNIEAGWVGAFLHGRSADLAVHEIGQASLVATDVIRYLPAAFRSLAEEHDHAQHQEHD